MKNIIEIDAKLEKKNKYFIKGIYLDILYSVVISLVIVGICSFSNPSFFFFDDAQSEFLPYFRSVGKIWVKGEIPFIVKNTIMGQNQMIDIHRAMFLPQNILLSILSLKISSFRTISRLIAFTNLTLMAFFSLKIGEALNLKKKIGIILALLFCINPIFIYIHLPSWWNGAASQVWFVGAFASIIMLRNRFCIKYLIFNIFTVLSLLSIGWSHAAIFYMFVAIFFVVEKFICKQYKELIIFMMVSLGIILIAFNVYSEYIISLNLFDRQKGFGNFGNFLSPNFNQIFMTFNPVYYSFMNRYGGYFITYIPMAYSSVYILILLCYQKTSWKQFFADRNIKFIFGLLLVAFILSQTPSQFGQVRYPFRFLPFFSQMLIIFSIYGIEKSELEFSKFRNVVFIGILLISSLLAFFSVEIEHWKILKVNVVYIILSISYVYVIYKYKKVDFLYSIFYTIFMLLLMLFIQKDLNGILSFPGVPDSSNRISFKNNFSKNGYLLSLTNGNEKKEEIEDLHSAQFLLYNIKSVSGYTPIGNKKLSELLDATLSHGFFNEVSTVDRLSGKFDNVCYFDLMNIDSIAIKKEKLTEEMKNKLIGCGYNEKTVENPEVLYYIKDQKNIGNVSYVSNGISVNKQTADRANLEKYQISSTSNGFMILSKPYWRGYRAYVNRKKVNISDEKGLLKLDNIPKGLNNATLEIKYFPASWRVTLWLGLLGIIEIIAVLVYFNKKKDFD